MNIAGSSGSGLVTSGTIIMKSLQRLGYYINADREYPSLIKGGHAAFRVTIGTEPVHSLISDYDVMIAIDRVGLMSYIDQMKEGSLAIHDDERAARVPGLMEKAKQKNVTLAFIPARIIAKELGGDNRVKNMVTAGYLWRIMGFDYEVIAEEVKQKFASKPKILEIDLKCLKAGFEAVKVEGEVPKLTMPQAKKPTEQLFIDGNEAIALGAIHAGVRAYYAYPMSPSSSILTNLAKFSHQTGMLVKQAEDEITVAELALGSMHMGTRALCATSGGGYDLMTETVSLAGIIETPFVCVICQRPGPATGLPTWTCQSDLNLAIHSAHGEFSRVVIGCSDPESCFELIQQAMNIAEKYQTVVLVLTEKTICETYRTVDPFEQNTIEIERGLVENEAELEKLESKDRFRITEDGVSKRWIPGAAKAHYYANSDEHREDGTLTEDGKEAKAMYDKRLRKIETIEQELPDAKINGQTSGADISVIGWGSTKNVMIDVIKAAAEQGITVNYLHYEYLWPFKEQGAIDFFANNKNVCLLEGNATAQLGTIIEEKTGNQFKEKFLKYDGRQFFFDEVMEFITKHT
jgi:2-oxoglutarate ferredoxin oxidoreductase subunit alpha